MDKEVLKKITDLEYENYYLQSRLTECERERDAEREAFKEWCKETNRWYMWVFYKEFLTQFKQSLKSENNGEGTK